MPTLPTIISKESVRVGGINTEASPNAFGYQVGRATQALGGEISGLAGPVGALVDKQKAKKDKLLLANAVAQTDLGKVASDVEKAAPPDGAGMADETFKKQKDEIDRMADATFADNPEARDAYKTEMYGRLPGWRDRTRQVQDGRSENYAKQSTNSSLDGLINRVRDDPTQYDQVIKDAEGIVDAGSYNSDTKGVVKQQLRSDLAGARFESMMANANDDDEFLRIRGELSDPRWQKDMTKEQYDRTQQLLKASRNSFLTGMDAQARSLLTGMSERSKARELIPDEEIAQLSEYVRKAKSPAINTSFTKLMGEQQLLRNMKDLPPAQLDQAAKVMRSTNPAVQGAVGQWASEASQVTGGEVPASYMVSLLSLEYSAADIKAGRYNEANKAGTSGAAGLGQFVAKTWLPMFQKYGSRFGYDPSKMSPAQILALRGDPGLSLKMTALYAFENKKVLQHNGIQPNDTDLYLAHFLGPGGAVSFIKAMRADPTGAVRPYGDFSQDQINANMPVFYNTKAGRGGAAKSFAEVYNTLSQKMQPGTTQAAYDNIAYVEKMRDDKQTAVNKDPMTQYMADGKMGDYELNSPSAYATAGADAAGAASYYNIPIPEMKPFTEGQAADLKKELMEGNADQQLQLLANIQNMDRGAPGMAKAAMAQLGEKDTVLGYAASLMYDKGEDAVASQIVRGQKIIKDDKTIAGAFGGEGDALNSFYATVGSSLSGMEPAMRDAIFNAAKAHYAETYAQRAGQVTFDPNQFGLSVQAVMGTSSGEPIAEVNGAYTVLPPGISAETFDTALSNMTDNDMAAMSLSQLPPRDNYGEIVPAQDIADEGQFVWIGRNEYKVRMSDGNFLITGKPAANKRLEAFVFVAQPHLMKKYADEQSPEVSPSASPVVVPGLGDNQQSTGIKGTLMGVTQ